jgi:AAA15 family ATPase/GTPase
MPTKLSILELHEKVYQFLEAQRKEIPSLRYTFNTNEAELQQGRWFEGTERVVKFSFWEGRDTFSYNAYIINIQVDLDEQVLIYINSKDSSSQTAFFEQIILWIGKFTRFESNDSLISQWRRNYSQEGLSGLIDFIRKDKRIIDSYLNDVEENKVGNFTFIKKDAFEKKQKEIEEIRENIYSIANASPIIDVPIAEEGKPLRLNFVVLENIGHFSRMDIDLSHQVTCIIGENGTGKSTILRAIALGLLGYSSDSEQAPFGIRHLRKWLKINQTQNKDGNIEYQYDGQDNGTGSIKVAYKIQQDNIKTIELRKIEYAGIVSKTLNETIPNDSGEGIEEEWHLVRDNRFIDLVIGFPQGQRRQSESDYTTHDKSPNINDIRPLILEYDDERLDNFTTWLFEQKPYDNNNRQKYETMVKDIFGLITKITTNVTEQEIELVDVVKPIGSKKYTLILKTPENPNGITLDLLSQGYHNVLGWVGALMMRLYETLEQHKKPENSEDFLKDRRKKYNGRYTANNIRDLYAIVLIDEIDTYLHIEWQRTILYTLVKEFPRIQFVVTTHSPDVVSNIVTQQPNDYLVYRLFKTNRNTIDVQCEDPRLDPLYALEPNESYAKIFHAQQYPKEIQQINDQFNDAISQNNIEAAKKYKAAAEKLLSQTHNLIHQMNLSVEFAEL